MTGEAIFNTVYLAAGNLLAQASPKPIPDAAVDPDRVKPGPLGGLVMLLLIGACVLLYYSMRKQLRRVNFDDGSGNTDEAGTRPVDVFPRRAPGDKSYAYSRRRPQDPKDPSDPPDIDLTDKTRADSSSD